MRRAHDCIPTRDAPADAFGLRGGSQRPRLDWIASPRLRQEHLSAAARFAAEGEFGVQPFGENCMWHDETLAGSACREAVGCDRQLLADMRPRRRRPGRAGAVPGRPTAI